MASGTSSENEQRFREAFDSGLLEKLMPGFSKLSGCAQPPRWHSEGDALVHTGKVFAYLALLLKDLPPQERYLLLVAALVHDIEKPSTQKIEGEQITFYGHAEAAARRSAEFAKSFHLDPHEEERLHFLVREHMIAHQLLGLGERKRLEIYGSPHFSALLLLQEADARGSWLEPTGRSHGEILRAQLLADRDELVAVESVKQLQQRLTVAMYDQLRGRGLTPGPYFGGAKRELAKSMESGDVLTEKQVVGWVGRYVLSHPPPA